MMSAGVMEVECEEEEDEDEAGNELQQEKRSFS